MEFVVLLIVALIFCCIGFKKFVWFISLGYGFSIAGLGVALMVVFYDNLTPITVVLSILCIIYGCRLGGYLIVRERKSASYQKTMKNDIKDGADMKLVLKIVTWVTCGLLYFCQISPIYFRLKNDVAVDTVTIVGTIIMAVGIIIESVSDYTKNKYKNQNPNRFCDVGLFKIVRCPNYFGEVLIWTGVLVSGITALNGVVEWVAALIGWVCIVYEKALVTVSINKPCFELVQDTVF